MDCYWAINFISVAKEILFLTLIVSMKRPDFANDFLYPDHSPHLAVQSHCVAAQPLYPSAAVSVTKSTIVSVNYSAVIVYSDRPLEPLPSPCTTAHLQP